jgi:hypothetical protein
MVRFLKKLVWMIGCVLGCQSAFGFALLGPITPGADVYQVATIGYQLGTVVGPAPFSTFSDYPLADPGTPKNALPNQGYRRNTPVIYYAFDRSFVGFFGTNGMKAVDEAMAVFNGLTNVSAYSPDLSEFPTDSRRVNFRAASDFLLDVKSVTMGLMTEQLGLFSPARWVWALHDRANVPPVPCPGNMEYIVDKRNFDIVPSAPSQYQSSSYVNGVLYSYFINERCTGPNPLADTIEFPVDPLSAPYSAVADYNSFWYQGLSLGTFYTSLTRDDVGGLRFLIQTNNFEIEPAGIDTVEFLTNSQTGIITNQDLHLFAAQAATNNPTALLALYPGLVINSTITNFGPVRTTNIAETFVKSPLDPANFPPTHPLFVTNFTTNFVPLFQYSFGNVVTNSFSTFGLGGTITLSAHLSPLSPAGTPPTIQTNFTPSLAHGVFGGIFILPTNFCSIQVLSNLFSQVIATTNFPATNILAGTTNTVTFTPGSVSFFTNTTALFLSVTCPTNPVADVQGIDRIRFVRRDYDSGGLNQFWQPVTNDYTLHEVVTNGVVVGRHIRRTVLHPDIVFSAADLSLNTSITYSNSVGNVTKSITLAITGFAPVEVVRSLIFDQAARPSNQAGPGTVAQDNVLPSLIIFNENGPLFLNDNLTLPGFSAPFLGEATQTNFFEISWGSFDGTTNDPIVYPNGSSITDLENLLAGPFITTLTLPNVNVGVAIVPPIQLAAAGGQAPYTWSLSPNSPGLPAGLNLTSDGRITGTATGPGGGTVYDFSVRVTDSAGSFKDVQLTITVF